MPSVAEWWQRETFIPLDWSPPTPPSPPRRRRWLERLVMAAVVLLAATAAGLGWLAWHEHGAAQHERAAAAREHAAAQRAEAQLHLEAARLQALQAKVDSNRQQLSAATNVAGELQSCIDATNKASSDFFGFFGGDGHRADSVCGTAEADYQQLQSGTGSPR